MPVYEFTCTKCGAGAEVFCPVSEREKSIPRCCRKAMQQVMSVSQVIPDIAPYRSIIDGSVIGSRSKHRAHLKQHGCIEVGNERLPARKPVPLPKAGPDIARAIREVRSKS